MLFNLEVVEFVNDEDEYLQLGSKLKHIGYMNKIFKTKQKAVEYYDKHNPHMRSLNAHGTFISDWDPETKLLYIVRNCYGIYSSIEPW